MVEHHRFCLQLCHNLLLPLFSDGPVCLLHEVIDSVSSV